jgi:hypothetical protein
MLAGAVIGGTVGVRRRGGEESTKSRMRLSSMSNLSRVMHFPTATVKGDASPLTDSISLPPKDKTGLRLSTVVLLSSVTADWIGHGHYYQQNTQHKRDGIH